MAVRGAPIVSLVCYCDTCQEGSRRIEALPSAPSVREADGGTAYVSYRKDRVAFTRGRELLKEDALARNPGTKRVVASCCNSAMMIRFDGPQHWIPIYRARFDANPPAIQLRICTGFRSEGTAIPGNVPSHRDYPPALMMTLLTSRLAMIFGR
jgi:hypothetical protein